MAVAVTAGARLYFVDALRASVIGLVVLHHLAIVYAGNVSFYYVEPSADIFAYVLFVAFELMNQAWFMGLLFMLSGYFTPASFERKGLVPFLKDKSIRLGIPFLAFTFLLGPLAYFIGVPHIRAALLARAGITLPLTWNNYFSAISPGPLWFVALLFVFDIGYAAWRAAGRGGGKGGPVRRPVPRLPAIGLFILLLASVTYVMRIIVPIGRTVLFFPTLSYLPQYFGFFLVGILAYRGDWLRGVSGSAALKVFSVGVVATLAVIPFTLLLAPITFLGRGTWQSAVYALYDSTFAVGMSMMLVVVFRRFFNSSGRLWRFLSQQSYAVYVIHPLVIIPITAILLQPVALDPLLKFGLAAVVSVPSCFIFAYLVRRVPLVDRVL